MASGQQVIATMPDGSTQTVPAPANIVLTCAPPDRNAKMIRPGQYAVTDLNKMECSTQPLYSFQAYPAAGATSLIFFQNPQGAGGTTIVDTNMQAPGQLPAPQQFLIYGIGVRYISGLAANVIGASSANSVLNDTNAILKTGALTLTISSKDYLYASPLCELPARSYVAGMAALSDSSTAGAGQASKISLGWVMGDVLKPNPLLLEPSMNFKVTMTWPVAVPIPSADAAARIGVYLYGSLYRPPQ